jgi:hypothetical protein
MKLAVNTTCVAVIALTILLGQCVLLLVLKDPFSFARHDNHPSERVPVPVPTVPSASGGSGGSTLGRGEVHTVHMADTAVAKSSTQPSSLLFMLASYNLKQFKSVQVGHRYL